MDINFASPAEIPQPRHEVRIRSMVAVPSSDGQRIRVRLEVDASQFPPSIELWVTDPQGRTIATASIIESFTRHMELTMHLREVDHKGEFQLHALLYFAVIQEDETLVGQPPITREEVDRAQVDFQL